MNTLNFVLLALKFNATVYGFEELYCGDYDSLPVACSVGAVTASGEQFNPEDISAAVPMPRNRVLRITEISLKAHDGSCITVRIIDKKNERYIGSSGLDLSPAAVEAITGKPASRFWSGRVEQC